MTKTIPMPALCGVHHTARPTWKLAETVHFYRDLLGLPLVHAVSARGWGPHAHPDFLHFFFDAGRGATIAFFYYIGTERPDWLPVRDHTFDLATHTAWRVDTQEELLAWRDRAEKMGVPLRMQVRHEVIESLYFEDPNGYPVEITMQLRDFGKQDAVDATNTIEAAIAMEKAGKDFKTIDDVWLRKGRSVGETRSAAASAFVLDVPEFRPLVDAARAHGGYTTTELENGYIRIDGNPTLQFNRKELGVKPAVWYGVLTGGFAGRIERFDMNELVIGAAEAA
ncbi:VOC family protein [Pseudoduganella sp. RAF53_2]|uniref:VOC family protein n=1 Tax=unclassified Pseudoduganella TaxID=2637179 RepID=UPI003F966228